MMMLPAFFARVNPVSTIAKPPCMRKTNAAPIRNKTGNTTNNIQNNVYMLDSKSLDEMIKNAEQNRKIDMIDVDFEQDTQIK